MKEIESTDGDVRIFAGGKTVIDTYEEDITKENIIRVLAVLVQFRGLNVKNGHLVLDDVKYIDNSNLEMLSRSKLRIGDIDFVLTFVC